MRRFWPSEGLWSLEEAARQAGVSETFGALARKLEGLLALEKAQAPIVGVVGLLNAGKSSFVASLLSPAGRERVLRGLAEEEGTQRFVFWLPEAWRSRPPLLDALTAELASVFGASVEFLSDDPAQARAQYNGSGAIAEAFAVPLLAFDPWLDHAGAAGSGGVGLLDCPDFQRPHPGVEGEATARVRAQFLKKAARLMSAVVVVADRAGVALEALQVCSDPAFGLASKRRFFLVNQVRPREPLESLASDGAIREAMARLQVDHFYAAYHFDMVGAQELIPRVDRGGEGLPVFFRVSAEPQENTPEAVGPERLIATALSKLDPVELWRQRRQQQEVELRGEIAALRRLLHHRAHEEHQFLLSLRSVLLDFVRQQVTTPGQELKFPLTPSLAAQMASAVVATAPWWARPAIWASQGPRRLILFLNDLYDKANQAWKTMADPGNELREQVKGVQEKLRKEPHRLFDAAQLARESRNLRCMPPEPDAARLLAAWEAIVKHFLERKTLLPSEELAAVARELWQGVAWRQKLLLAAAGPFVLIGGLLAVCLIAIDGGVSLVLAASLQELMVALGVGWMATSVSGIRLEQMVRQRVAIPFYVELLQVTLDTFGLPREMEGPLDEDFANVGRLNRSLEGGASYPVVYPLAQGHWLAGEVHAFWQELEENPPS